ncbi:MAG: 4Fe-4S binding protein [Candidatus Scalindua sp.]|jgi:polyferredoxin|nr:4Fe-4S binding protein [Candidatus Scalindua sp.]MDV5165337.1 4Fe-4S binding protein [Candidatus Scalindua sp.]
MILFFLIKHYGKGVYCGWICSCGGMAETLGEEYRRKTPHGPGAKRLEISAR